MVRRLFRYLVGSGLLLGAILLVRRTMSLRDEAVRVVPSPDPWPPIVEAAEATPAWLPPIDGACPPTHLIKAKATSHIYHLPGMVNYNRTKPDRCYAAEDGAEADGFTKAKR